MATVIVLRAVARKQGLTRYFTGKPCKRGHVAERYVRNLTCVECDLAKQKEVQWAKNNRERHNENGRRTHQRHKEAQNEKARAYRAANRELMSQQWFAIPEERRKARRKVWRDKNLDKIIKYNMDWEQRNIDKVRERKLDLTRRRRVQKLASPGQHTAADLEEILRLQNYLCAYCRADLRKVKKHLDHITPLAPPFNGSNDRRNLQYTCGSCNRKKSKKDPLVFARERGLLL